MINENSARMTRESYLKNPVNVNKKIEEIIMAITAGVKNNFTLFEKPRISFRLIYPINET